MIHKTTPTANRNAMMLVKLKGQENGKRQTIKIRSRSLK